MFIRVATLMVTFAVALSGIFLNVSEVEVKFALAALAAASFVLAMFIEIQASQDADFAKRALGRLIQASTPSDLFADAVTQIAVRAGVDNGLGMCKVVKRSQGKGYVCQVIFTDESGRRAEGYFEYDHQRLAEWSLLDESRLPGRVAQDMFEKGPMPTADPMDNWHDLVGFIGAVGQGLYPDDSGGPLAVSADAENVKIGLPYPPGVPPIPGRTKHLPATGAGVPFLLFNRNELAKLAGESYVGASRIVGRWLHDAWGPPTILRG